MQAAACAPYPESLRAGAPVDGVSALTIADGIAVKRPGEITLPILAALLDDMVVVGEDETAEAMVLLLERCKLVVEGAGAVGVAALLGGGVKPARLRRDRRRALRRQRRRGAARGDRAPPRDRGGTATGDAHPRRRPPGRARAAAGHAWPARARTSSTSRTCAKGWTLHVRETAIEMVVETRGREHADRVLQTLNEAGYPTQVIN